MKQKIPKGNELKSYGNRLLGKYTFKFHNHTMLTFNLPGRPSSLPPYGLQDDLPTINTREEFSVQLKYIFFNYEGNFIMFKSQNDIVEGQLQSKTKSLSSSESSSESDSDSVISSVLSSSPLSPSLRKPIRKAKKKIDLLQNSIIAEGRLNLTSTVMRVSIQKKSFFGYCIHIIIIQLLYRFTLSLTFFLGL